MERFIVTQTTTNDTLKESIHLLTSRVDAISTMEEGLEESPVMVLQEVVPVLDSVGTEG